MDNNQRSVPSSPAPGSSAYFPHQDNNLHHDERTTPPTAFHFPQQTHQGPQPPVLGQPTGIPMQVLIDPATGQHYMIPQYYPPPMYPYPSAQPIPPPMYYHHYAPGMPPTTSAPPPNHSSNNSINYMGMYHNPTVSASHEEKDGSEDTQSTTSNISRSSFSLMQNQKAQLGRENSREYMYLHRSPTTNPAPSSPLMRPKLFHQRLEDPRGGTQSDFEGKTPVMRPKEPTSSASDHESTKRFSRTSFGTPAPAPVEEKIVNPPAKSVRMEINFADVPSMPSEPKPAKKSNATAFTVNLGEEKEVSLQEAARTLAENRRKIKLAKSTSHDRTPSTPEALAASRTNKNYLLERLLTGGKTTENSNGEEEEVVEELETPEEHRDFDARSEALTFVIDTSRRNNAGGGYGGQAHFQQQRVVQYSDDDDSDSDSEFMEQYASTQKPSQPHQTAPPPPAPPVQLPSPRPSALPAPGFSRQLSSASTLTAQAPPPALTSPRTPSTSTSSTPRTSSRFDRSAGGVGGSDFLQELAKLRMMAGLPAAGPTGSEAENRAILAQQQQRPATFRRSEVSSSARAPTVSSSQKAVGLGERGGSRASFTGKTKETVTTPTPTRRSENRRSLTGNSSPQLSNLARPPFRTGANRGIMIGQSEQQREQEMTAWLRRKDYNPMKAAAAGKKSEMPSREMQFQSRRSMTFHNTDEATSPFGRTPSGILPSRPAPRNRSQEPRDINNEKYRAVQKDQRLKRTVDMLSQKCKKSIELIRIQNKGCLSVSVEDLLSAAAEEPRPNETLDEQLDRLSDAFDAVQRYLEQYSLDGYHSPTSDDRYFDDDALEAKSTFSGVSTHQERHTVPSTESLTSSYRKKILDS
uniref:BHLH domain-containing protein n=1 Tax=Caenorhabditis tropicalis TaxID=1561998 RepID=A0A1I7U2U1_9PELO